MFFIKPLNGGVSSINIRVKPGVAMNKALPTMEAVFKKLIPSVPFDYKFTDEDYALKFAAEERIGKLAGFFTILAVFISCLGLFGLASFVAGQRTKEVGIRKVLGASEKQMIGLFAGVFIKIFSVACLLAIPLAWYVAYKWLQDFPYRVQIQWWVFAIAGFSAITIALFTVSFQAIRAATANPVKNLRTE